MEGLQFPAIPLLEVVGSIGAADPLHIGAGVVKVGVTWLLTVTVTSAVVAHCPALGVKVYVAEAVLLTVVGLHVPVMPLLEVVGKTGAVAPVHIGGGVVNVGTI